MKVDKQVFIINTCGSDHHKGDDTANAAFCLTIYKISHREALPSAKQRKCHIDSIYRYASSSARTMRGGYKPLLLSVYKMHTAWGNMTDTGMAGDRVYD